MRVIEPLQSRVLVARLERGDALKESLVRLAEQHDIRFGWVSGLGAFEWAEVCEYDQQQQEYRAARRLEGGFELLALQGNLSLKCNEPFAHLHVVLSQEREHGNVIEGGHLNEAVVFACELRIECYEGLEVAREPDSATGLALWPLDERQPHAENPQAQASTGSVSWAAAAAVSQAAQQVREHRRGAQGSGGAADKAVHPPAQRDEPSPSGTVRVPERGDWVQHGKFGLCRVDRRRGDELIIRVEGGRRKTIKLNYLSVLEPYDQDGKTVYPLRGRRAQSP